MIRAQPWAPCRGSSSPAPYPLRVARAGADDVLVAWQAGDAQTLEVRAAFVRMPP